jgi:hypothetical protein
MVSNDGGGLLASARQSRDLSEDEDDDNSRSELLEQLPALTAQDDHGANSRSNSGGSGIFPDPIVGFGGSVHTSPIKPN